MLQALAHQDTLRVFAAVVAVAGTGLPQRSGNSVSITFATVTAVSRRTGLSDHAVTEALRRLTDAHLTTANPDGNGWRTDVSALSRVVASMST